MDYAAERNRLMKVSAPHEEEGDAERELIDVFGGLVIDVAESLSRIAFAAESAVDPHRGGR